MEVGSPDLLILGAEPPQDWAENTVSGLGSIVGSGSNLLSKTLPGKSPSISECQPPQL